jgi:hypothetical protein
MVGEEVLVIQNILVILDNLKNSNIMFDEKWLKELITLVKTTDVSGLSEGEIKCLSPELSHGSLGWISSEVFTGITRLESGIALHPRYPVKRT